MHSYGGKIVHVNKTPVYDNFRSKCRSIYVDIHADLYGKLDVKLKTN